MPIDNYYEGELLSLQSESKKYDEAIASLNNEYQTCANPWIDVKINSDGSVNPCVQDFSSKYIIGNVNDNDLFDILNSKKALKFRKAVLTGDMEYLDTIGYHCKRCNTWGECVKGSINGVMNHGIPIRLGLVINEISGTRPSDTKFLEHILNLLENEQIDLVQYMEENVFD